MKKQLFTLAGVALMVIAVLGSCKKGENDPFLSLKSRNARVTGTWELVSSEITTSYSFTEEGLTYTETQSASFNGSTITYSSDGSSITSSFSQTLEILKDGTYTMTNTEDGSTSTTVGNWWWIDSNKKKVRIAFDDDYGSFYIDRLKNKEMVLTIDNQSSDSSSEGSENETVSATYTYEKK